MSSDVVWREDKQTVVIKDTGVLSPIELARQTALGIELLQQHGGYRVLVDCSELEIPDVSTMDLYKQPDVYEEQRVPHNTRIAVILPRDNRKPELFTFYDDTSHNRGYNVQLFNSDEEAWRWLEEPI